MNKAVVVYSICIEPPINIGVTTILKKQRATCAHLEK